MIEGEVTGGDFSGLLGLLRHLAAPDLMPLGERIRDVLVEGNRAGLMAGLDADGVPMAPLAESTIKRGREGFGPPTVPRFAGSQLIDRFRVTVSPTSGNGISVKGGWPGVEQLQFFQHGTRFMPRRNPVGVRPATRTQIQAELDDFAATLIGGRSRFGDLSGFGLL